MSLHPLASDTPVFYRHPERSWEKGTVHECIEGPKGYKYTLRGTPPYNEEIENIPVYDVHKMLEGIDQREDDDLLELSELHVAVLLSVLRNRFKQDKIYTYIGSLAIAVNPFKWDIPRYQKSESAQYIEKGWNGAPLTDLTPHSWAIANKSYWDMRTRGNQSILISGESGAGKTEGAKIIVEYLGTLCTRVIEEQNGTDEERQAIHTINEKLRNASPILESFGNAKTVKNDNSSRFGKFMKIQFNSDGVLVGMDITPYLLEKSRVIVASKGERLYHSFYHLAAGASPEQRDKYLLQGSKDYKSLNIGGVLEIKGVDDAEEFKMVEESMRTLGFSDDEQDACWRVVAICLHLSCIVFTESSDKAALTDSDEEHLQKAATVMQVPAESLKEILLFKSKTIRNETTKTPLTLAQAKNTRNSISMILYERQFLWSVQKINSLVSVENDTETWIGLLDIFGFENFTINSFEQLCINLANERLQKHYNTYVYGKDLQECKDEGIRVTSESVTFNDNQKCLDLIDGITSLLDDVCKVTKGDKMDDFKFRDRIVEKYGSDQRDRGTKRNAEGQIVVKRETPADYFEYDLRSPNEFAIHHYAGKVVYDIRNFVVKNTDILSDEITDVIRSSKNACIHNLVAERDPDARSVVRQTISKTFKSSLIKLLATIDETTPNWVRCIRPNGLKKKGIFETPSVLDQLTCSGVVETVKTRQRGYCYRVPFNEFFARHGVLGERCSTLSDSCATILRNLKIDKKFAQVGKTKVFLMVNAFHKTEQEREKKLRHYVITIQKVSRWRQSCVRVLDRKWQINSRKLQNLIKFLNARDNAIREHYRKALSRLKDAHKKQREELIRSEMTDRSNVTKAETSERFDYKKQEKDEVAPLWAAMLLRIVDIECDRRLAIISDEGTLYRNIGEEQVADAADAVVREATRIQREKTARKEARLFLYLDEESNRKAVRSLEAEERVQLRELWIPVNEKMQTLARRINKLNSDRHRKLWELQLLRDMKQKKARDALQVTVKEEHYLWSQHSSLTSCSSIEPDETLVSQASLYSHQHQHQQPPQTYQSVGLYDSDSDDNDDDFPSSLLLHANDQKRLQQHATTSSRHYPTRTPAYPGTGTSSSQLHHQQQRQHPPNSYQPQDTRHVSERGEAPSGGFFSRHTATALGVVEARRQQERFYAASIPSTIITSVDPSLSSISSYEDYVSFWSDKYNRQKEEEHRNRAKMAYYKDILKGKKRRDTVNARTM